MTNHDKHSLTGSHAEHPTLFPQEDSYTLKNFIPLILIITTILIATIAHQMLSEAATVYTFMNSFMGIFFVVFGGFKIVNLKKFAEAYATYDLLAQRSRIYAFTYPFVELALGIAYLTHWRPMATFLTTMILMGISSIGVLQALLKRESLLCACLGTVFKIPMTYVTLFEDIAMLVMALTMIFMQLL